LKTLKQEGVPFGARMVFRAQHALFLAMAIALTLTLPFAFVWSLVHESGSAFIRGATVILHARLERVKRQREKLARMYATSAREVA
jgi:hypothetical protein